MLILEKILV